MQAPVTMMCPHCRHALKLNAAAATAFKCPKCQGTFTAPKLGKPEARKAKAKASPPRATPYQPAGRRKRLMMAAGTMAALLLIVSIALGASFFNHNRQPSAAAGPSVAQDALVDSKAAKTSSPAAPAPAAAKVENPQSPPPAVQPQQIDPVDNPPPPATTPQPPGEVQVVRSETRSTPEPIVQRNQQTAQARTAPPAAKLTAEEKRIEDAILRGVRFLQQSRQQNNGHAVGYAAFPGLALLECGVPANDQNVQQLAQFVRNNSSDLRATYELALAVLFLDRLGDRRDEKLIQTLALRLVAGQNANGGWSYHCPLLSVPEETELITFLKKNRPQPIPTPLRPEDFPNLVPLDRPNDPRVTMPLPTPQNESLTNPLARLKQEKLPTGIEKSGDTQTFDPLPVTTKETPGAAPVPPRHPDSPMPEIVRQEPTKSVVEPPVQVIRQPFPFAKKGKGGAPEKHKGRDEAGFDDRPEFLRQALPVMQDRFAGKKGHRDDNSNTHFAILALWAARRHDVPMVLPLSLLDRRFRSSQYADGRWGYRFEGPGGARASMTAVGLLGLGIGHGNFREIWSGGVASNDPSLKLPPRQDPAIQKGLTALGQYIDERGAGGEDLYFMWTVERVAVLYNLDTIAQKDWYRWGSQHLLAQQSSNGSWHTQSFNGSSTTIDTCMALLFLRKTNLLEDLTRTLQPFVAAGDRR